MGRSGIATAEHAAVGGLREDEVFSGISWLLVKGWSGRRSSSLMRLGFSFTAVLVEGSLSGERLKNWTESSFLGGVAMQKRAAEVEEELLAPEVLGSAWSLCAIAGGTGERRTVMSRAEERKPIARVAHPTVGETRWEMRRDA